MSFKFSTNFLLPYVRKPAKYWGRGSIGLDATPTVLIHIGHPVLVIGNKIETWSRKSHLAAAAKAFESPNEIGPLGTLSKRMTWVVEY